MGLQLDVLLGSDTAPRLGPPRLRERSATAWSALFAAVRAGQPSSQSLSHLAFLARTRLAAAPPSDEAAGVLLKELRAGGGGAEHAALLLSRWASTRGAGALLGEVTDTALQREGPTVARALLLSSCAHAAPPARRAAAWAAALQLLEQRTAELCAVNAVLESLAAAGWLLLSAETPHASLRVAAASLSLAASAAPPYPPSPRSTAALLRAGLSLNLLWSALCGTEASATAAAPPVDALLASASALPPSPALCLAASGALRALLTHSAAHPSCEALRELLCTCAAPQPPASGAADAALPGAVALSALRLPDSEFRALDARCGFGLSRCCAEALLCDSPGSAGALAPLRALLGMPPLEQSNAIREALSGALCAEAGALTRLLSSAPARLPPPLRERLFRAVLSLGVSAERLAEQSGSVSGSSENGNQSKISAFSAACILPHLVLTSFLTSTRAVYFPGAQAGDAGAAAAEAAGAALGALSRLDFVRVRYGGGLPVGYSEMLKHAATALRDGEGEAGPAALLSHAPLRPCASCQFEHARVLDEAAACECVLVDSDGWGGRAEPQRAERAAFLLRALPFTLPTLIRMADLNTLAQSHAETDAAPRGWFWPRRGPQSGAPPPPLPQPQPQPPAQLCAAVDFALAYVSAPFPGEEACAAPAHSTLRLLLHSPVPLSVRERRGWGAWRHALALRYGMRCIAGAEKEGMGTSLLLQGLGASFLALRAADQSRTHALLDALSRACERSADSPAAPALRAALFDSLPLLPPTLLPPAMATAERLVRRLRNRGEKQEAMRALCAAAGAGTEVDGPRKRAGVEWCLQLASTL